MPGDRSRVGAGPVEVRARRTRPTHLRALALRRDDDSDLVEREASERELRQSERVTGAQSRQGGVVCRRAKAWGCGPRPRAGRRAAGIDLLRSPVTRLDADRPRGGTRGVSRGPRRADWKRMTPQKCIPSTTTLTEQESTPRERSRMAWSTLWGGRVTSRSHGERLISSKRRRLAAIIEARARYSSSSAFNWRMERSLFWRTRPFSAARAFPSGVRGPVENRQGC